MSYSTTNLIAASSGSYRSKKQFKSSSLLYKSFSEVKYNDVSQTSFTSVSSSGSLTLLTGIATGTDSVSNRIGRSIELDCLNICISLKVNVTAVVNFVRAMVVMDCCTNGTSVSVTDVLQSASVTSPVNVNNRARFVVFYDNLFSLSSESSYVLADMFFRKLNVPTTTYSGSGSTYTSCVKGHLYLLLLGDNSPNPPTSVYFVRVCFKDS